MAQSLDKNLAKEESTSHMNDLRKNDDTYNQIIAQARYSMPVTDSSSSDIKL